MRFLFNFVGNIVPRIFDDLPSPVLPWFRASVLPCFRASVLPCFRVSVLLCFRAFRASVLSCFRASVLPFPCFSVSVLLCFLASCSCVSVFTRSLLSHCKLGFCRSRFRGYADCLLLLGFTCAIPSTFLHALAIQYM